MRSYVLLTLFCVAFFGSQNIFAHRLENEILVKRPYFSGKWSIDVSKSRFSINKGSFGTDVMFVIDIRQKLPLITFSMRSQVNGGIVENWKDEFYTDGRSTKLASARDPNDYLVAVWEGSKLVVRLYESTNELVGEHHYELLAGGNSLQITFKLTEGRWGYSPNPPTNVIDEEYTDYLVFNRVKEK